LFGNIYSAQQVSSKELQGLHLKGKKQLDRFSSAARRLRLHLPAAAASFDPKHLKQKCLIKTDFKLDFVV
jgi:hypothetical protein